MKKRIILILMSYSIICHGVTRKIAVLNSGPEDIVINQDRIPAGTESIIEVEGERLAFAVDYPFPDFHYPGVYALAPTTQELELEVFRHPMGYKARVFSYPENQVRLVMMQAPYGEITRLPERNQLTYKPLYGLNVKM